MKKAFNILTFIGTPDGKRDVTRAVTAVTVIIGVLKQFGVI